MKIGITTSETSFHNYPKWIKGEDEIEIIELSYETHNLNDLKKCDGVVFSGGVDICPQNPEYENAPKLFNTVRDQFETEILRLALEQKMPILGICRGLQLINNYFGGDLQLDLGLKNNAHKKGKYDKIHEIYLDQKSQLFQITGQEKGFVNSAHHQAINNLANCLNIAAASLDGVIEAVELKDVSSQFLMAVQWHPERLEPADSPFSKNIREAFLKHISQQKI